MENMNCGMGDWGIGGLEDRGDGKWEWGIGTANGKKEENRKRKIGSRTKAKG